MIRADFYRKSGSFSGFEISGHAGYAEAGSDVACAAVSSAVQLSVNMLGAFECRPEASAQNNIVKCEVSSNIPGSERIIEQLRLHLESILEEFPNTIQINISEV